MKVNIAGVFLDAITKHEVLLEMERQITTNRKVFWATPYSEMIVFANKNSEYRNVLNKAALSLPDGIGILWAAKYLSLPASNFVTAFFQIVYSGASIIFNEKFIRSVIPEQISGSRLIWDVAALAERKGFSLGLAGGENGVALQTAFKLKQAYPELKISLAVSDMPFDERLAEEIATSNSDILLIAYSPPKQETWLAENIEMLNVKVAIGLGGTFDYVSGHKKPSPPVFYKLGLEWLWRLISQPYRIKRMWNAIPVYIWIVYKNKLKVIRQK